MPNYTRRGLPWRSRFELGAAQQTTVESPGAASRATTPSEEAEEEEAEEAEEAGREKRAVCAHDSTQGAAARLAAGVCGARALALAGCVRA